MMGRGLRGGPVVLLACAMAAIAAPAPAAAAGPFLPEPTADSLGIPGLTPGEEPPPPEGGSPGAESSAEPEPAPRTRYRTLSDEMRLSRWAYVLRATYARVYPSRNSREIKRLSTETEDGTPELVLLLLERTKPDGEVWIKVRLPMRPNNTTGWVLRSRLGGYNRVTTRLHVNRERFLAKLYRDGRAVWGGRIGIGKKGSPTPGGRFYVRERLVPRDKNGIYGVFAFGTSAYSSLSDWPGGGVVGIHGTNQPWLIPGRISHGCVRVENSRISKLRDLMPLGTPIEIE